MIYKETDGINEFKTALLGGTAVTLTWDISGLEAGKWHEVTQTVTTVAIASGSKFNLFVDNSDGNSGVAGEQTMYFDNLKWIPLDPRE